MAHQISTSWHACRYYRQPCCHRLSHGQAKSLLGVIHKGNSHISGGQRLIFSDVNARTIFLVTRVDPATVAFDGVIGKIAADDGIRRVSNTHWRHGTGSDDNDFTNPGGSVFKVNNSNSTGRS